MKQFYTFLKTAALILLPPLLIVGLAVGLQGGKNILEGLYLLFPLIFLIQALLCPRLYLLLLGAVLNSVAFLLPIGLLYHMGSCVDLLLVYLIIGAIGYLLRCLFLRHRQKRKPLREPPRTDITQ